MNKEKLANMQTEAWSRFVQNLKAGNQESAMFWLNELNSLRVTQED